MSDNPSRDLGNHSREIEKKANEKADDLEKLGKILPGAVRSLRVYGDIFNYIGKECDRLEAERGQAPPELTRFLTITMHGIEGSLTWDVPAPHAIEDSLSRMSLLTSGTAGYSGSCYSGETAVGRPMLAPYFNKLPDILEPLSSLEETCQKLDQLKAEWGVLWRAAWDNAATERPDSAKNAATNARTVVDEMGWMVPQGELSKCPWCEYDKEGKPTRASRYAYIRYGPNLPPQLNKNPGQDPSWKPISEAYNLLNKYTHRADTTAEGLAEIKVHLKIIQSHLTIYLVEGQARLRKWVAGMRPDNR